MTQPDRKFEHDRLERAVEKVLMGHGMLAAGRHILAAVSGGADSMALLHVLHALAAKLCLRVTIGHLNHGLRGAAANADEQFVQTAAAHLGCACHTGRADVAARARRRGISLEMAGREARYAFLARTARRHGCDLIATAHTADDQAETILLKFLRGAGPQGLAGIARVAFRRDLPVIRPLRDIRRRALIDYLHRQGIAWREDASNTDPAFMRNRLRHNLVPLLEREFNPRVIASLVRLGDVMEQENKWLDSLVDPVYRQCLVHANATALNGNLLAAYPTAVRRRVLRRWLAAAGLPPAQLDFKTAQRLEDLLTAAAGGKHACLPGGRKVRCEYGILTLTGDTGAVEPFSVPLQIPGETLIAATGWRVQCRLVPAGTPLGTGDMATLSAVRRGRARVIARNWRPGDRMLPYGMRGSRKLQDIFGDLKVPASVRRRIPVFECRDEIIWLPGYRIARGWALPADEKRMLLVSVTPPDA